MITSPAAVDDQRRLADRLQIFERLLLRCAPFADRLDLGAGATFSLTSGSRLLLRSQALRNSRPQPGSSGLREMHAKPEMIGLVMIAPKISCASGVSVAIPRRRGPVPTKTSRLEVGRRSAMSCATKPPI